MPATHMLDWRWQQTRVTVRTARSSTQVMLLFQIIREYKTNVGAGRIEQERNKRQSRSHPTRTTPWKHLSKPNRRVREGNYWYMTLQFRKICRQKRAKFAMLVWFTRQCIKTCILKHENATADNLQCFKFAKRAMLSIDTDGRID